MKSLILHPETESTRARMAALRDELHALFNDRIRLSFELFPRLRDRYGELFGDLEREVQERTLELSERRRLVELFSLKLDRGQKLDPKTIELVMKAVRNEFARVRSRMQAAFSAERREQIDTTWRQSPFAGPRREETNGSARRRADELRDLYRTLAKRLHPDSRPGGEQPRREYWDLVQRGYHRGDLPLLRTIAHLVETLGEGEAGTTPDTIAEERRLSIAVRVERAQIDALRRDELFQMRESMNDERWVASRRRALEDDLAGIDREIAKCDRFLAPIFAGGKMPSPELVRNIWSSFVEDMYLNNR
jgi:hypothetical protein